MIFEYTSTINIDENDMNRICNDVKNGRDFCDAFDDVMSEYDDCDYYHTEDIYDSVKAEIERRIKEMKGKNIMPTVDVTKMTDEELDAIRKEVNKILNDRREERRNEAIDNFRKAFEEVKKFVNDIYVEDYESAISISYFDDFNFD